MRQKRQQRTGANSLASSFRYLGGMSSGPETLPVFKERSTQRTLRAEIMMEGIGLVKGRVGRSGALESLKGAFLCDKPGQAA